jgi:hypothetical protein
VFFVALGLALFFCRFPVFFLRHDLNIDEAMLVAQALTFKHHPMPWRDVDPTTNGPLNGYALLWGAPFGLQPSYFVARLTGLACTYGMMVFLCLAGRRIAGDVAARISILPVFILQSFPFYGDYFNYTNEQVSLFLIGWAIYLLGRLRRHTDSIAAIASFGLVVGLLPWAKLQSVMPGAALDLVAVAFIIFRRRSYLVPALVRCGVLVSATAAPCAFVLLLLASTGSLDDFWSSYIEMARSYGIHYPTIFDDVEHKSVLFWNMINPTIDIDSLLYLMAGVAAMVAAGLIGGTLKPSRVSGDWYWSGIFLTLVMVATILATNLPYIHYQLFMLPALGLLALASFRLFRAALLRPSAKRIQRFFEQVTLGGFSLAVALAIYICFIDLVIANRELPFSTFLFSIAPLAVLTVLCGLGMTARTGFSGGSRNSRFLAACWLAFFVTPFLLATFKPNQFRGHLGTYLSRSPSQMDQAILNLRQSGARLAIWGWSPQYAAETGTPLGTRDSHTQWAIDPNPLRDYFRQRYLRDMETIQPQLFLEAVGPQCFHYTDREQSGIACFPELDLYIARNYRLAAEIDGMRLFVWNGAGSNLAP